MVHYHYYLLSIFFEHVINLGWREQVETTSTMPVNHISELKIYNKIIWQYNIKPTVHTGINACTFLSGLSPSGVAFLFDEISSQTSCNSEFYVHAPGKPAVRPVLCRVHWKNTRRWTNAGLTLAHLLRRWPNINPALFQRILFAANY